MSVLAQLTDALADRYRLERELGAGGMATVYLAHDLRHDRDVAIKVLHPDLGAALGGERFLAEIRTTAKLQHPHILPLLDSGAAGSLLYYVMPYIAGETLRTRLERERQLPIADALLIAREVADALGAAHALGIVHRDIKPENILLQGGHALVADFGIALAVQQAGGQRMTQTGLSLGTPQYMSPEQAMGEKVMDARSDIYALGAVTYEMLVGEPPFTGPSVQAIVARLMSEEPRPIGTQRRAVPAFVEDAVLRALEKLPADRFASAAEFAAALAQPTAGTGPRAGATTAGRRGAAGPSRIRATLPWIVAAGAVAVALALGLRSGTSDPPSTPVSFTITGIPNDRISSQFFNPVAVSPDGQTLVYVGLLTNGRFGLLARRLDVVAPRELPGTEDGNNPIFSPDGRSVAFIRGNDLYRIALDGSTPLLIGPLTGNFTGASWSRDGRIIVSGRRSLYALPENGGAAVPLPGGELQPGEIYRGAPLVAPDGRHLIFSSWSASTSSTARLAILDLASGEVARLDATGPHPIAVIDDAVVYTTAFGQLMAVPVDLDAGKVTGPPVQLLDAVTFNNATGLARVALSPTGTLFFQERSGPSRLVRVGPDGVRPIGPEGIAEYSYPRLSPDGTRLAIGIGVGATRDVWIHSLATGTSSRLTGGGINERAEWTPDGTRVLYRSNQSGRPELWWRPADLSTEATPLFSVPRVDVFEGVFAPDGRRLALQVDTAGADVYYRDFGPDSTLHPVAARSDAVENMPRISPDGRWITFVTDESGRSEVVVQPLPGPGGRVQVSTDGGTEPLWSRDGRRLFYRSGDQIMAVTVGTGATFTFTTRDSILRDTYLYAANPHANWDVMPDGRSFVFLQSTTPGELTVYANWLPRLRALLAGRGP